MSSDIESDVTDPGDEFQIIEQHDSERWKLIRGNSQVYSHFYVEFVDGIKTDKRKCIKCSAIESANFGTSSMKTHREKCLKRQTSDPTQGKLKHAKAPKIADPKHTQGLNDAARLVYEDNFPITSVASSAVLKQWAKRLGYGELHYSEINQRMTEIYQQIVANITTLLSSRKNQDVICLSFDKWKAIDSTKFIGGYLY